MKYVRDEGLSYLEARLYGYRLIMDSLPELYWRIVDPRNDGVLDEGEGPLCNAEARLREGIARGWLAPIAPGEDCRRYPSFGALCEAYMEIDGWESTLLPTVEEVCSE